MSQTLVPPTKPIAPKQRKTDSEIRATTLAICARGKKLPAFGYPCHKTASVASRWRRRRGSSSGLCLGTNATAPSHTHPKTLRGPGLPFTPKRLE
jgi:hypothetical protein